MYDSNECHIIDFLYGFSSFHSSLNEKIIDEIMTERDVKKCVRHFTGQM